LTQPPDEGLKPTAQCPARLHSQAPPSLQSKLSAAASDAAGPLRSPALLRKALVFTIALLAVSEARAQATIRRDTAPLIALRMAYPDSAVDRERYSLGDSTVFLSRTVLLTDSDLVAVEPIDGRTGTLFLRLSCGPAADQRLRKALGEHVGHHLAVVIEDRIASAPVIQSPIGCIGVDITTRRRGSEAARLRSLVEERWPR
jgi:preprotein translocase subunit SecD